MDKIKYLYSEAKKFDACPLFSGNESKEKLIRLFMTPQGIEFCQKNNFPSLEDIRYFKGKTAERNGVYIDSGTIARHNTERIALVGGTFANLTYDDSSKRHVVVLMHGAKARITAKGYAVVFVYNTNGNVETETHDSAKILL